MSCSKKYNCFLPSPIIRGKNETKEQFIFKQKNFFKDNLQHKTSFFKGKPVFLTKRDEPGDACFNKFAIGKEEYHKTMQIDMRRVERLHWIFPIIENFEKCESCGSGFVEIPEKTPDRIVLRCIFNQIKMVIVLVKKQDHYELISFFRVSK